MKLFFQKSGNIFPRFLHHESSEISVDSTADVPLSFQSMADVFQLWLNGIDNADCSADLLRSCLDLKGYSELSQIDFWRCFCAYKSRHSYSWTARKFLEKKDVGGANCLAMLNFYGNTGADIPVDQIGILQGQILLNRLSDDIPKTWRSAIFTVLRERISSS